MHYRIYSQYHIMREKSCFFWEEGIFRALTASSGGGGALTFRFGTGILA